MDAVERNLVEEFKKTKGNEEAAYKYSDEEILLMNKPISADYDMYIYGLISGNIPYTTAKLEALKQELKEVQEELTETLSAYEKMKSTNHQGASELRSEISTYLHPKIYKIKIEIEKEMKKLEANKQILIQELQAKSLKLKENEPTLER